jgi:hypothetical protein
MSSLRFHPTINHYTKFLKLTTPSYYDNTLLLTVPIPFIYNNSVLDINVQDTVQADLIDSGTVPTNNTDPQCKTFGGTGLVFSLGPKMLEWLTNWLTNEYGSVSNIHVFTPGQVIKAQYAYQNDVTLGTFLRSDVDDATYAIASSPPSFDEYVSGDISNNYRSVWLFKTPLTISFRENGTDHYLTLFTNYAGND